MNPPFKVIPSDAIPMGRILFIPPVEVTRVIDKDGRQVAEVWEFNPKGGAVIENVKVDDGETEK